MDTILISHDSCDEKIAAELKTLLEGVFLNVHVYVSGRDLIGGQTWIEEIKNRLKSSKIILSLLTLKSLKNTWVYFESGSGFTEDKTIPLLTDNLKPENLTPPLSLLQVRLLTVNGFEALIRDISNKLNQRESKSYIGVKELVDKIEKLLRSESVQQLKICYQKLRLPQML